jgi:hypothetical protein
MVESHPRVPGACVAALEDHAGTAAAGRRDSGRDRSLAGATATIAAVTLPAGLARHPEVRPRRPPCGLRTAPPYR